MQGKKAVIILVAAVIGMLGYLGMHVTAIPYPEEVLVVRPAGTLCPGSFTGILEREPGVVGVASMADAGEYHIGINGRTTPDVVRARLAAADVPVTVVRRISPIDYKRAYGRYFRTGEFASCNGGCR